MTWLWREGNQEMATGTAQGAVFSLTDIFKRGTLGLRDMSAS